MQKEISDADVAASQALEQLEQLKDKPGSQDQGTGKPGLPDKDGLPGTSISMTVMDTWLEQIEGDPAHLLRNQFRLEEQKELQRQGSQLMETRPW
jgi:Ca-activated chloride channel family protein